MRIVSRPTAIVWILGLALLVGTVTGAGWVLHRPEGDGARPPAPAPVSVPFEGRGIVCFGFVDVEPGVVSVYPVRPGRVVWAAEEGRSVQAGEPVLKLDDSLARQQVEEATIALEEAELQLEEAEKTLAARQASKWKQQQAAVNAAVHKREAAQQELALEAKLLKEGQGNEYRHKAAEEMIHQLDALVAAEQEKLEELKLYDPATAIRRLRLDVRHKKTKLDEAQLGLRECTVAAPADGTVLRAYTRRGEVLGPSPKLPALEFCPDAPRIVRAEVPQEWADKVRAGQAVILEDDSSSEYQWHGEVQEVSDWFTHRRSIIQEPFQFNDVRTLECLVKVLDTQKTPLRIGQRMRVMIQQGGP